MVVFDRHLEPVSDGVLDDQQGCSPAGLLCGLSKAASQIVGPAYRPLRFSDHRRFLLAALLFCFE